MQCFFAAGFNFASENTCLLADHIAMVLRDFKDTYCPLISLCPNSPTTKKLSNGILATSGLR